MLKVRDALAVQKMLRKVSSFNPASPSPPTFPLATNSNLSDLVPSGFGYQNGEKTSLVTEDTVFRVGSITKLFTDLALMIAVDAGLVSLDDPVSKYLPDFSPGSAYAVALNCRHLVSHVSGLSREPPVGHYFDADPSVTLGSTVLSLNSTSLLYEPGTTQKYSNAAIAVVGLVLERVYNKPWAQLMRELLLEPLGMDRSEFEWSERVKEHLARGAMWAPDFRLEREPPFFELGESPAGSLYTTVSDLEKFANLISRRGELPNGKQLLKHGELFDGEILRVQFPDANRKGMAYAFGIGWQLMTQKGVEIAAHGGAIYGYTARLVVATKRRFSLVFLTSGDCAMTTVKHITNYVIEQMARYQDSETGFPIKTLYDIPIETMRRLEGAYIERGDGKCYNGYGEERFRRRMHVDHRFGKLMLKHDGGYSRLMLAKEEWNTGDGMVPTSNDIEGEKANGRTRQISSANSSSHGTPFAFEVIDRFQENECLTISVDQASITWCGVEYERIEVQEPRPAVYPELEKFIGEFGPDHVPVFVFERYGRLFVLLEWVMQYPLRRASESELLSLSSSNNPSSSLRSGKKSEVWLLPSEDCFYADEKLVFFDYDASGFPNALECTGMVFERRLRNVSSDKTFQIDPLKSLEELRLEARQSSPPPSLTVGRLKPDLVDMGSMKPKHPFLFDIRYATENNFMGAPFYKLAKAFAQRPAAHSIEQAHHWLNQFGYGLVIFDVYRPWHVTKMFYEATPAHLRHFVAPPEEGSIHNRGCAIDCGLYDLNTGKQLTMVSGFDEMTPRSYRDYPGGSTRQRWQQTLLRTAMQMFDFEVYEYEWWHFNYASQKEYPVMNVAFEDL